MAADIKNTAEKIKEIIVEKLDVDPAIVQETSTLKDLGADSLDMIEIIMKVESEFNIEIDDEAIEKFENLHDLIVYVNGLRSQ
jgi:acyl carrier protein